LKYNTEAIPAVDGLRVLSANTVTTCEVGMVMVKNHLRERGGPDFLQPYILPDKKIAHQEWRKDHESDH
jgi:hypothetical protein